MQDFEKSPTVSDKFVTSPDVLISNLSFSHIVEIMVIDDKYYFIDLVFYNRLLHCNVIIELKNDEFKNVVNFYTE